MSNTPDTKVTTLTAGKPEPGTRSELADSVLMREPEAPGAAGATADLEGRPVDRPDPSDEVLVDQAGRALGTAGAPDAAQDPGGDGRPARREADARHARDRHRASDRIFAGHLLSVFQGRRRRRAPPRRPGEGEHARAGRADRRRLERSKWPRTRSPDREHGDRSLGKIRAGLARPEQRLGRRQPAASGRTAGGDDAAGRGLSSGDRAARRQRSARTPASQDADGWEGGGIDPLVGATAITSCLERLSMYHGWISELGGSREAIVETTASLMQSMLAPKR